MSNEKLTHIVGTFLIQAEGAFLNGAGTEPYGQGDITIPKTFMTLRDGRQAPVPYVSSQAWKRWLRDTFQEENLNEPRLAILTTDVNKQNNTNKVGAEVDPIKYAEADIFGFMKAEKGQGKSKEVIQDEEDVSEESVGEENKPIGREKVKPAIRTSPFQSSILISLRKTGWEGIDKGFVHPKGLTPELEKEKPDANPTPLPYNTKFYNTQLQGIFGLAYSRLGVFRNEGDRIELAEEYQKEHIKLLSEEKTKTGKIFRVKDNQRKNRTAKILKSLSVMRGGAKQAQFGTPVHPQVLILAGLSSGNLIFNNIFEDSANGPKIKIETLEEVLKDYTPRLASNIYIGIRTGYLSSENEKMLREWAILKDDHGQNKPRQFNNGNDKEIGWNVVICTPIEAAEKMSTELPQ